MLNGDKITSWNQKRKGTIILESIFALSAFLICIYGLICEIYVHKNIVWFPVNEINNFVLTILGVQATVCTLSITIISLISNNINKLYMGLSVGRYYLDRRPLFLSQKIIISVSIGLLVLNCILYVFAWYNIILALFTIDILLIIVSAVEICTSYRGIRKAEEEISSYFEELIHKLLQKNKSKKAVNLLSDFVTDWADIVEKQTDSEYIKYKNIFVKVFKKVLEKESESELLLIEQLCEKQIYNSLSCDNKSKLRGMELISDIYSSIWSAIIDKKGNNPAIKDFKLVTDIDYNLVAAMKELPLNQLQIAFKWEFLTDIISRIYFSFSEEVDKAYPLESLINISQRIGYIIKEKELRGEMLHDKLSYWGIDLSRPHLDSAFNIPKENADKYLKYKCKNYFYYCKGFIDNEYVDIVKENIYYRGISNSYYSMDKYEILYYLSIDCYLYYLAEKESTKCVDSNIKASAKSILEDDKIKNINEYLFSIISDKLIECGDLEQDLQNMMSGCEWFPKYSNGKTLIMESVVREFYIFVQLYLNCLYRFREQKEFPLSENAIKYIMQFLDGNEENTKKNIEIFLKLFTTGKVGADDLLSHLDTKLKKIYKNECIDEAKRIQENYVNNVDESSVSKTLQNNLEESFKNTFENIPFNENDKTITWSNSFNLINCNLFTDMISESVIDKSILSDIFASFILNVANELIKKKLIKSMNRADFENDDNFLAYVKENNYTTLIGSEYTFKNSDYKNTDKFNDTFKRMSCIFYGYYRSIGLALFANSFKINIKKVNLKIGSVTLSNIDYTADEKGEILSYNVTNNVIIPFEKNELIEYIKNKRKMISVSVEAEFSVNGNDIGSYIMRED